MTDAQDRQADAIREMIRDIDPEKGRCDYNGETDGVAIFEIRCFGYHMGFVQIDNRGLLTWM